MYASSLPDARENAGGEDVLARCIEEEEKKVGEEWMNDWITDKKTNSEDPREIYKRYIDVLFFYLWFSFPYSISSWRRQTDRQTDIRHRYYKKLLFKSNHKPNNKTIKPLFSQNAHSMVALLVAIAVVFVSSPFFSVLIDLDLDLSTPSPPLPLTHVYTNKLHILITSLFIFLSTIRL